MARVVVVEYRRRPLLGLGVAAALGGVGIWAYNKADAVAHPFRLLQVDPNSPGYTFDGKLLRLPPHSDIIDRKVLDAMLPANTPIQNVVLPWYRPPEFTGPTELYRPIPRHAGYGMSEHPFAIVLCRESSALIDVQGQMLERAAVSPFAGCGPLNVWGTDERAMLILTPYSIRANLERAREQHWTYKSMSKGNRFYRNEAEGGAVGLEIVSRDDYFKCQMPIPEQRDGMPNSGLPHDTWTNANGVVADTPQTAYVQLSDGAIKHIHKVVATVRVIIGAHQGVLIESPDQGEIQIINPINPGVFNPAELVAVCPPSTNTLDWGADGDDFKFLADPHNRRRVVMPLYKQHSPSLKKYESAPYRMSLEQLMLDVANNLGNRWNSLTRYQLPEWHYFNDWPPAVDIATRLPGRDVLDLLPNHNYGSIPPKPKLGRIPNPNTGAEWIDIRRGVAEDPNALIAMSNPVATIDQQIRMGPEQVRELLN